VLQNGNVLVQGTIRLLDQAVSYDYVEDGSKFDIEYLLINISEKNVKSIEFGYAIHDLTVPEAGEQYTDKALNLVTVTPISNDRVAFYSAASRKQLVVDNELKILCDVTEFADTRLVADNVFLMDTYYDENTKVTTAVNERGEKLATIPYSAEIMENYILYEGDVYNFKMELMLELSQYTVEDETETFMILSKRDSSTYVKTYYYYDPTTKAPVAIQNQNREDFSFNGSAWFGYQISYTNADGDTEYVFYNSENAELSLGQDKTVDLDWWYSDDEESFVILSMDDGTAYIVRK
jgi:hypothetical protein